MKLNAWYYGVVAAAVVSLAPAGAIAGGDAANGEALSATCAACHGADGNSTIEANPILAGQYESYLVQALKDYRSGARQNAIMAGFAAALSDQDIRDLAAYFASQESELATLNR
jgi:cytochrome c553